MKNKFKEIQKDYQKLKRKLPRLTGQLGVNFFKDNFRRQGFKNNGKIDKWKKRKNQGAEGKRKRGILIGSTKLKRSIGIVRASPSEVMIAAKGIDYAQIHNEGGKINQTVTNKQRAFFWAKFKATGNELWKRMALATKLEINIPKRQFMGNSTDLDKQIDELIFNNLKDIFN